MAGTDPAAFAAALKPHQRLMGLDVGEKTIGLALSDVLRGIATPYETIRRGKFTQDMESLKTIAAKQEVGGFVVGWPVNMDGSLGPRCQSVRTFCANMEKLLSLPVLLWDERMSTMAVERAMLEADLSRQKRAGMVDKLAAAYILQGALDALSSLS